MARKMKDSGVEWIGMIPDGWSIHRLKSCVLERDAGAWGSDASGDDGDMVCLRIADFDYGRYKFKDVENPVRRNYDKATIERLVLKKNDLLVEKSGGGDKTPVGRMVLFDKDYPALYANFMDRLRCRDFVVPKWFLYLWNTFYSNGYVWNYIKQTTGLQNYDLTSMLAGEKVALPTLIEQRRIVDYLDAKCTSIDHVIDKTNESIEEYKKLKQTVITEAVTKGVRGNRSMKDSGIPWYGKIPSDVSVSKVGRHYDITLGKMLCDVPKSDDMVCIPYICAANVHFDGVDVSELKQMWFSPDEIELYKVQNGDLLIVEGGAGAGGCAIVQGIEGTIGIQNSIQIIRSKDAGDNRYLCYALQSLVKGGYMDIACNKATIPHFTKDKLSNSPYIVWSIEERREIADYLDSKCAAIDTLISKKQQFIDELTAYKKSLIYEYVTGKKEVPA